MAYYPCFGISGGGGGGGSTITHGTTIPTAAASENDLYYLLDSYNKLKGLFMYISNNWVLIDGIAGNEAVRVWTHSTGDVDASIDIQKGHMTNNVFVADGTAITKTYTELTTETVYFDLITIKYESLYYIVKANVNGLTDGTNTYNAGDVIDTWAYNETNDLTIHYV